MTFVEKTTAAERQALRDAMYCHVVDLEEANEVFASLVHDEMQAEPGTVRSYELSLLRMIQRTVEDFLDAWHLTIASGEGYALKNGLTWLTNSCLSQSVDEKLTAYEKKLSRNGTPFSEIQAKISKISSMEDAKLSVELDKRLKEDLV